MGEFDWSDKYMSLDYLIPTEQETIRVTNTTFADASVDMKNLMNLFLSLAHFLDERATLETDDHLFQNHAYFSYLRIPYSFKATLDLWLKGYYLEAIVLVRHIVEVFVQLRYFDKHRDRLRVHLNAERAKDRVTFRTMFEDTAPGSYDRLYGVLSSIAHGGIMTRIFRSKYDSPRDGKIIMGCKFDEAYADFIINQAIGFGYGYLNYADKFFPTLRNRIPEDIRNKLDSFLQQFNEELQKSEPTLEQLDFYNNVLSKFVEK